MDLNLIIKNYLKYLRFTIYLDQPIKDLKIVWLKFHYRIITYLNYTNKVTFTVLLSAVNKGEEGNYEFFVCVTVGLTILGS